MEPFKLEILLVEDNLGDMRLIEEAMKIGGMEYNMNSVRDGEEAIEFLHKKGRYSNVTMPDIVLLDLRLPKKSGYEVLEEIKTSTKLKHIPVIILTSSNYQEDIDKTYKMNANCFITKPIEYEKLMFTIKSIKEFWTTIASLPRQEGKEH